MHYDMCMRSIERIEDLLADSWYLLSTIAFRHGHFSTMKDYEALDFEGVV